MKIQKFRSITWRHLEATPIEIESLLSKEKARALVFLSSLFKIASSEEIIKCFLITGRWNLNRSIFNTTFSCYFNNCFSPNPSIIVFNLISKFSQIISNALNNLFLLRMWIESLIHLSFNKTWQPVSWINKFKKSIFLQTAIF